MLEKKCLSEMGLIQGIGHGTAFGELERLNRDPEMAPQGSEIFGLAAPGQHLGANPQPQALSRLAQMPTKGNMEEASYPRMDH